MQALLSYDQSPPLGAPLLFFLTAPLFGMLAGVVLLTSGADALVSRWAPATLAVTHLVTVGFMLQIMLGAMIQILPVVAGANLLRPRRVAGIVHVAITLGALLLTAAFLSFSPALFKWATLLLGFGIAFFVVSAGRALWGVPSTSATIRGLKHALSGLGVTTALGIALAAALGWSLNVPLLQLTDIHLVWGFVAWGAALLAAVAYVVVPMFQITPAYPAWFERAFTAAAFAVAGLWTLAELSGWTRAAIVLGVLAIALVGLFAGLTLWLQQRSRRPRFDANQRCWRVAMFSVLAACGVWLAAQCLPQVGDWSGWPLLCGALLLFGGFMSVMVGMLYKIVPFLVWLHLQNAGSTSAPRIMAPNMKKIIAERDMDRQVLLHFFACAMLLLAVFWPAVLVYPAGLLVIAANALLLRNLWSARTLHRDHLRRIASLSVARES